MKYFIFLLDSNQSDSVNTSNVSSTKEDFNKNENVSFLINDITTHLPRVLENEENESDQYFTQIQNNSITNDKTLTSKNRQICWHLPKKFEPSIESLENQIFRFINIVCIYLKIFHRIIFHIIF